MLSRVLVSWRLLAIGLVVAVLGLAGLAVSVERQQSARTLQGSIDEADLVTNVLLQVHLSPNDNGLSRRARHDIDQHLDVSRTAGLER